jgi:hypothetical protein
MLVAQVAALRLGWLERVSGALSLPSLGSQLLAQVPPLVPGGQARDAASLVLPQELRHRGQDDGAGDHLGHEAAAGQMTGQRGQLD